VKIASDENYESRSSMKAAAVHGAKTSLAQWSSRPKAACLTIMGFRDRHGAGPFT
jgi:hypothetical protein